MITTEDLDQFKSELLAELKELLAERVPPQPQPEPVKWLKSHQVQRMLGISPGTLQNLRINRTIPYTKLGGVILYSKEEIKQVIERNKRNRIN